MELLLVFIRHNTYNISNRRMYAAEWHALNVTAGIKIYFGFKISLRFPWEQITRNISWTEWRSQLAKLFTCIPVYLYSGVQVTGIPTHLDNLWGRLPVGRFNELANHPHDEMWNWASVTYIIRDSTNLESLTYTRLNRFMLVLQPRCFKNRNLYK